MTEADRQTPVQYGRVSATVVGNTAPSRMGTGEGFLDGIALGLSLKETAPLPTTMFYTGQATRVDFSHSIS